MQIKTDTSILNILKAAAVRIFEKHNENVPTKVQNILGTEAACDDGSCYVDSQGFVAFKGRRKKQK